jgi:hypothetical protein
MYKLAIRAAAAAVLLIAAALGPVLAQQRTQPAQGASTAQPKPTPTTQQKAPSKQKSNAAVAWAGNVVQPGNKGYSVIFTLRAGGGETEYPELNCDGKLARVGSAGGFTFYVETITRGGVNQGGRCIDGSITTKALGDNLAWGWVGTYESRTVVAHSVLQKR